MNSLLECLFIILIQIKTFIIVDHIYYLPNYLPILCLGGLYSGIGRWGGFSRAGYGLFSGIGGFSFPGFGFGFW